MKTFSGILIGLLCLVLSYAPAHAEKKVMVFVALCDNKTQGIIPVGAKIGNGDDPDSNLYWGCTDGFGSTFKQSKNWRVVESSKDLSGSILRRMKLQHTKENLTLTAEAYRGSKMRECLEAFEQAAASGEFDLVAYAGHNGLMDFHLPLKPSRIRGKTDAIVLCCISGSYFGPRLDQLGCRTVLATQQLMYPGSFLLHDALEVWRRGGDLEEIRQAAAKAYAANQKISLKAATGIFCKPGAIPKASPALLKIEDPVLLQENEKNLPLLKLEIGPPKSQD